MQPDHSCMKWISNISSLEDGESIKFSSFFGGESNMMQNGHGNLEGISLIDSR